VAQAEILDQTIGRCGASLAAAVLLDVADSILVDRIAGRRACPKCGAGYHVTNIPPRAEGVCDACGTELTVRKDDAPETVTHRLAVYQAQTVPLIAFYETLNVLRRVAGTGPIDEIAEKVKQAL
jgi:adenylate kinase